MSDTPTASEPELLFNPYNPDRNIVRRCASLTVNGVQCKQAALRGQNYCVAHIDRQPRAFENPGHIVIPLLEDHSAIQLTCTKVGHALANERMKPDVAKEILHACTVANSTLPRPARLQPSDLPQPRSEAALSVVDQLGTWIATCEPFLSPSGEMTKYDELDARWTRKKQSENAAEIDPAAALTNCYKQLIVEMNRQRIARETQESAAALAAGLPDPHAEYRLHYSDDCPFGTSWCGGPWHDHHCDFCRGERQLSPTDPRRPGDELAALAIALSKHVRRQPKQNVREDETAAQSAGSPATQGHSNRAQRDPVEERAFRPASAAAPEEEASDPENSPNAEHHADPCPEPALVLNLNAAAARRSIHRGPARRTRSAERCSADGRPNVVKSVNTATHNIPNHKKLVPSPKHNISPQKAKERSPRSLSS